MEEEFDGAEETVDAIYTTTELLFNMQESLGCGAGPLEAFDSEVVGRMALALEALWANDVAPDGALLRYDLLEEWVANLQLCSFKYRSRIEAMGRGGRLADIQDKVWGEEPCIITNHVWEDGAPKPIARLQVGFKQSVFNATPQRDAEWFSLGRLRQHIHEMSPPGHVVVQLRVAMYDRWAVLLDMRDLVRYATYCHTHAYEVHIHADSVHMTRVMVDLPKLECGAGLKRAALMKPLHALPPPDPSPLGGVFSSDALRVDGGFDEDEMLKRTYELAGVEGDIDEDMGDAAIVTSDYDDVRLTADDDDCLKATIKVMMPPERGDGYARTQAPDGRGEIIVPIPDNAIPGHRFEAQVPLPIARVCRFFSPRPDAYVSTEGTRNWAVLTALYTRVPNPKGLPYAPLTARAKPAEKKGRGARAAAPALAEKRVTPCWELRDVWLRLRQDRGTHPHPALLEVEVSGGTFVFPHPIR